MKLGFVKGMKARLKTSRTDVAVAQCRKLIRAASTVTSILRSRAFSDPMLDILEATVREKVRTLWSVIVSMPICSTHPREGSHVQRNMSTLLYTSSVSSVQVTLTARLVGQGNGGVLGTIHAGLHARGNIEDIGEQSYVARVYLLHYPYYCFVLSSFKLATGISSACKPTTLPTYNSSF